LFVFLRNTKIVFIFAASLIENSMDDEIIIAQEQLARFAKALGHPIRIAIMRLLAKNTCYYHGAMAEKLPIANSTLSQHLKELKAAGLIFQETITLPSIKYCIHRKNWELAKRLFDDLYIEISK